LDSPVDLSASMSPLGWEGSLLFRFTILRFHRLRQKVTKCRTATSNIRKKASRKLHERTHEWQKHLCKHKLPNQRYPRDNCLLTSYNSIFKTSWSILTFTIIHHSHLGKMRSSVA
jgi:hypothetical protein